MKLTTLCAADKVMFIYVAMTKTGTAPRYCRIIWPTVERLPAEFMKFSKFLDTVMRLPPVDHHVDHRRDVGIRRAFQGRLQVGGVFYLFAPRAIGLSQLGVIRLAKMGPDKSAAVVLFLKTRSAPKLQSL